MVITENIEKQFDQLIMQALAKAEFSVDGYTFTFSQTDQDRDAPVRPFRLAPKEIPIQICFSSLQPGFESLDGKMYDDSVYCVRYYFGGCAIIEDTQFVGKALVKQKDANVERSEIADTEEMTTGIQNDFINKLIDEIKTQLEGINLDALYYLNCIGNTFFHEADPGLTFADVKYNESGNSVVNNSHWKFMLK
jgi:hypothetical protein